jgi:2-haloacid dehalogenase
MCFSSSRAEAGRNIPLPPDTMAGQHTVSVAGREIEAVVFDLGGVLIDWDPRHVYRGVFADPAEMEDFLSRVCTPEWHRAHDLGADVGESCERLARTHPAHREAIMTWADRYEEMAAGPYEETVAVLADVVATDVPCYALSNMEADTFRVRCDRFAFMRWFDGYVISGIEGLAKPDRRIFELLLARYDLDPAATVFVDDSAANVAMAGSLGITALRFTSAQQLRGDLGALGVVQWVP